MSAVVASLVAAALAVAVLQPSLPLRAAICGWCFWLASAAGLAWMLVVWFQSGGNRLVMFRWYVGLVISALGIEAGLAGYLAATSRSRYYSLGLAALGAVFAARLLLRRCLP